MDLSYLIYLNSVQFMTYLKNRKDQLAFMLVHFAFKHQTGNLARKSHFEPAFRD